MDETGKYSLARVTSIFVSIAATAFVWKLIIMGGMSVDYFLVYLVYGAGQQTLNKFLDIKKSLLASSDSASK